MKMRIVKKTDGKIVEGRKAVSDYPEGTLAHAKGGAQAETNVGGKRASGARKDYANFKNSDKPST